MIIDTSYFKGKLFIPNVQNVPNIHPQGTQPNNQDKLTDAINEYERLLLVNALGFAQYDELVAAISDTVTYLPGNKWYDLVNGKTYDNKRFDGLKKLIGYYVYCNFLKYDVVHYNTTGLERSDAANSTSVAPVQRIVDYWNTFVNLYQYYECCGCLFYGEYNPTFVSLQQYLSDNSDLYETKYFQFYAIQNELGI